MVAALTGCASKPATTTNTNTPAVTDTKAAGGDDLSKLMKSAAGVKEMSFDTVMTMTGKDGSITSNGKMYISNSKVRMEMQQMGMKMITIMKSPSEIYLYNPDTKSAMKLSAPQSKTEVPNAWAKESGDTTGYKIIGSENKDGFDCHVVQYNDPANTSSTSKMWVRKDIGMPVRVESTSPDGNLVMEYKNYNLGAQDASLFDLPAGTQITAMPALPTNLPK